MSVWVKPERCMLGQILSQKYNFLLSSYVFTLYVFTSKFSHKNTLCINCPMASVEID